MRDLDPDTAAELRLQRARAAGTPQQDGITKRLLAWLARKDAQHDRNAGVRASRRRWRTRRRDSEDWKRHHGGSPWCLPSATSPMRPAP
jgi:hypothetical protein